MNGTGESGSRNFSAHNIRTRSFNEIDGLEHAEVSTV